MKFENILNSYQVFEDEILQKAKLAKLDVKDVAKKFATPVSTAYSKLNGNAPILHNEKIILADLLKVNKKPLTDYEDFLKEFSKFVAENDIFKQIYFLNIIKKDNVQLKNRFKNPLGWRPDEIIAILKQLRLDLKNSPIKEIFID